LADDDLFAVGYLAGEVEGGQVYAAEGAAGEGQYVGYSGAGWGFDQAGAADLTGDMDYDRRLGGRLRGGLGCGRLGWGGLLSGGVGLGYGAACRGGGRAGVGDGFGAGSEEGPGDPGQPEDEQDGQDRDVAWGEGPPRVAQPIQTRQLRTGVVGTGVLGSRVVGTGCVGVRVVRAWLVGREMGWGLLVGGPAALHLVTLLRVGGGVKVGARLGVGGEAGQGSGSGGRGGGWGAAEDLHAWRKYEFGGLANL